MKQQESNLKISDGGMGPSHHEGDHVPELVGQRDQFGAHTPFSQNSACCSA